jgi:hypothetical protein
MPDDNDESDTEEEEEETPSNPLQTQQQLEQVNSDHEDEPPAERISQLQVEDPPVPPQEPETQDNETEPDSEDDSQIPRSSGIQTLSHQTSAKKGPEPAKRGKKGKAKKIATKYKDQDEEDRLAAQQLIGAAAGLEKARAEVEAKAAREAELAFQKERRRAQHQRTQKETAEHEEIRRMMLEEGHEVLDEGEEEKMTTFEALVGMPLKGDEILEAIPVCAPWAAMAKFKYKEILGRWVADTGAKGKVDETSTDSERMWPREVELLKGWKVEEITNTVPVGKVRVMMAGGSAGAAAGKGQQNKGKGGSGKGIKKQR